MSESPNLQPAKEDASLPMSPKWDPEKLAKEIQDLKDLKKAPFGQKVGGYVRRTGPGLLQSAMTLGAGSATASVLAGASFGYKLLWVQPIAMFLGIMMLGALSNVVLSRSDQRPYKAFGRETCKSLVLLWAIGTIFASVIWHFPQYTLLAGAGRDFVSLVSNVNLDNGGNIPSWVASTNEVLKPAGIAINSKINNLGYIVSFAVGLFFLITNIIMVFSYGSGGKGIKLYERFLRLLISLVIIFFLLIVILNVRKIDWLELFRGFTGYYGFPKNAQGVVETSTYLQIFGMLGAAVGINMTFLYPYSLLAKGWGNEHRSLARWDLTMTMFIPFSIVTSLIIIAMTITGVYTGVDVVQTGMAPMDAAKSFAGIPFGREIFCLGLMGMCGGAISVHMLVCGFTMCEMLGIKMTKNRFRFFALTPTIGFLGVVVPLPLWFPVIASAICCVLLPIAYLLIFIMNNKRSYIGNAVGGGLKRFLNNIILIAALAATFTAAYISVIKLISKYQTKSDNKPAAIQKADIKPILAPKLTDTPKTDAKPADAPKVNIKLTDAQKTDAKPADASKANIKPTDAQKTDAKPADAPKANIKPTDAPKTDVK